MMIFINEMYYGKLSHKILWGFKTNMSPNLGQKTKHTYILQRERKLLS